MSFPGPSTKSSATPQMSMESAASPNGSDRITSGRPRISNTAKANQKRAAYARLSLGGKLRVQAQQAFPASKTYAAETLNASDFYKAASEQVKNLIKQSVAEKCRTVYEPYLVRKDPAQQIRHPPATRTGRTIAEQVLLEFKSGSIDVNPHVSFETFTSIRDYRGAGGTGYGDEAQTPVYEDADEDSKDLGPESQSSALPETTQTESQVALGLTPENVDRELLSSAYVLEEFSLIIQNRMELLDRDQNNDPGTLNRFTELEKAGDAIQEAIAALRRYEVYTGLGK